MRASIRVALVLLAFGAGCAPHNSVDETDGGLEVDAGIEVDAGVEVDAGIEASCGDGVLDADELCDSDTVTCTALGAGYASGMTKCKADCSGFAISTCTRSTQTTEVVMPALRMPTPYANAKCNDGTPFDFWFLPASKPSKKWVISFEGGGRCDGRYNTCTTRSTYLSSSKTTGGDRNEPTNVGLTRTIFDRDPSVNPELFDANFVKAHYCSSDIWTGQNDTPQPIEVAGGKTAQWVFTGRINARAMLDVLKRNYGLDDRSAEVLITGNSAGGFGSVQNVDQFATRMPKTVAERRVAVFSSAFFQSGLFRNPDYSLLGLGLPDSQINEGSSEVYRGEFNTACTRTAIADGRPLVSCGAGANIVAALVDAPPRGLGIRTFVGNNRVDQGPMNDYAIPSLAATNTPADVAARTEWKSAMTTAMQNVAWLWAPADDQRIIDLPDGGTEIERNLHGVCTDDAQWNYEAPDAGTTLKAMFSRFWNNRSGVPGERVLLEGEIPHGSVSD